MPDSLEAHTHTHVQHGCPFQALSQLVNIRVNFENERAQIGWLAGPLMPFL